MPGLRPLGTRLGAFGTKTVSTFLITCSPKTFWEGLFYSTHMWHQILESNSDHIGGRRVLSPLRHIGYDLFVKKNSWQCQIVQ